MERIFFGGLRENKLLLIFTLKGTPDSKCVCVCFFLCELLYNHETKTASLSALTSSKSGTELTTASAEILRFSFSFCLDYGRKL